MKAPSRIVSTQRCRGGLSRRGGAARHHLVAHASALLECDDRVVDFQAQPLTLRMSDDGAKA